MFSVCFCDQSTPPQSAQDVGPDRKSTRLNSSHSQISYAVFCLKKKKKKVILAETRRFPSAAAANSTPTKSKDLFMCGSSALVTRMLHRVNLSTATHAVISVKSP